MADTYVQVTNTGQTVFSLPFSSNYLLKSHVKVYKGRNLLAETQTSTLVEGTDYTFTSATQITLTSGLASGEELTIQRQTPKDAQLSPWSDGSNLTSEALNNADLQNLYIVQEQSELNALSAAKSLAAENAVQNNLLTTGGTMSGEIAMGSNKITGLADPVNAQDAATKGFVGTALTTHISSDDGVIITDNDPASGQIKIGLDGDIATLKDMQTGAATQLKDLLAEELAILDNKSFRNSDGGAVLDTTSDTQIPSSKVIAAHVASSQLAIGGFIAIANETSFPNSMPEAGVVVSINDAHGIVINGSGIADQGTTVGGTTVTINNFPDSLKDETLAAGTGLIVTATSTANQYTYHKLLATESDIKQLSDTINDFHSRYRIASSDPVGTTAEPNDDGDLYWNTSTKKMRVYEAAHTRWVDLVTAGDTSITTLSAANVDGNTVPGGNTSGLFDGVDNNGTVTGSYRFRLNNSALNANHTAAHHLVSLAGVIQKPNTGTAQPSSGYAINGNDIVFASPPLAGTGVFITTIGSALTIGTPSDNTVTNAKIVDDTIAEAKLDISNAPADGKFLQYKDSTDKLTWTFADAHITLEADGNIADNHAVIVTSAGKAKEIHETITTENPPTILDPEVTNFSGGSTDEVRVSYDPVKNYIFTAVGNDGDDLDIATYEWDNANSVLPNFTANVELASSGVGGTPSIASHPTNGYHFVVWTGSNVIRGRLFNFNNSGQALSGGDQVVTSGTSNNIPESGNNIIYSPDDDKFLLIWTGGSGNDSDDISVSLLTPDYTNKTVASTSTSVVFDDAGNYEYDIFYDEYSNKVIAACWKGNYLKAKIGTIGSTSISWGSAVSIAGDGTAGNNGSWLTICGEPETGKMLFAWMQLDASENHHGKCKVVSVDGTGFSTGSETTFNNTSTSSRNRLFYDPTIKKLVLAYRGVTGGVEMGRVLTVTISGTTPSFTSYVDITHSSASNNTGDNASHLDMAYHPTLKRWCYVARGRTNTGDNSAYTVNTTVHTGGAITNLSNSFIGFSDGSFTNGQIAKINVTGNTTTQSSLTTGSRYYVNEEGNLSLSGGTPNVVAGLAVSPTKLLIKAIPTDSNIEYSIFTTNADGLVPRSNDTGDTDKFLKGDGTWSTPGMTLIDTLTIGNNSSYTTDFGANWWNTYKYIKLIYFGSYVSAGYTLAATPMYFQHNSISTDDSYEVMELHHHNSSNNSDNELGYSDYSSGILAKFRSNGEKFHIDCEIYSDGTNTSFKSSVICSNGSRSGLFYTFLASAGSSFEFRQPLTNGSSGDSNRRHFPGTAKFYGVN